MNHDVFFAYARRSPFGGRLSQNQVDGTNALLASWERHGDDDLRKLAYILATVFHETGARMVPVRETFATSDAQAIRRLDAAWAAGKLPQVSKPYWRDGWFGRGPVQVTHRENYVKVGDALGLDLTANPGLLLQQPHGADSTVVGMVKGLFAQRARGGAPFKLADYFSANTADPVGARRIVNGTDKASLIATYYHAFHDALKAAAAAAPPETVSALGPEVAPTPVAEAAKPDGPALSTDKTTIGGVLAGVGGAGGIAAMVGPVLQNIANVWALVAFALVLVAAFLVLTGRVEIKRKAGA